MPRLGAIELSQLPPFSVLEQISTEAILRARLTDLKTRWAAEDPPMGAVYDVDTTEFDPLRINQETNTFFELTLRDRVNQAARSVTTAFAVGSNLDAIASRYPGGMPRIALVENPRNIDDHPEDWESDATYRTRIWLSPNTLTQNGMYENYVFFALTAAQLQNEALRDAQADAVPGKPDVYVTIMAEGLPVVYDPVSDTFSSFPSPLPSTKQITDVFSYITARGMGRKGLTDVVHVQAPRVVPVNYRIRYVLYPGWDQGMIDPQLKLQLAALIESQRYLGFSHTLAAIDAALKVSGVFNILVDEPAADVVINDSSVVQVNSIKLTFAGRGGIGPLPPNS